MIIQLVFDGILILFKMPLNPIKAATHVIAKKDVDFFEPSFRPHGQGLLAKADFLVAGDGLRCQGKDLTNEETIELLSAYTDLDVFTPTWPRTPPKLPRACASGCAP